MAAPQPHPYPPLPSHQPYQTTHSPNGFPGSAHQQAAQWTPGITHQAPYEFDGGQDDAPSPVHEDSAEGGEGREAKRRRIARACDMCRKKKIKCDGALGPNPKCGHCVNYKTECIFTTVEKKRAPPKGAKYIEGLENRLGRMENLLKLSGLLAENDGGRTDLGTLEKQLAERQGGGSGSAGGSPSAAQPGAQQAARTTTSSANGTPKEMQQQYLQHVTPPTTAGGGGTNGYVKPAPPGSRHSNSTTNSPHPSTSHNNNNITSSITQAAAQQSSKPNPDPFQRTEKETDALADQMCSLITNNCGETRYIGSSSGFSIFSPKGIQWVNEKTGDASFQTMIANASSDGEKNGGGWDHWKPEVFNDLFERKIFKPLPDRSTCMSLLKDYFEHFNQMFPLFHEPTFMHLVDKHYSLEPYEGSGWWASLNVALAIAHRLRVMSNVVGQEEDEQAWGYLKNAMGVMTELTMRNTDLLSVQALLGMALFLQGTPNPQPSFFLVAAAIRLAHSIGLHKRGSGFGLNAVESEQRKRVFWIAYLLDKDICLRSGRPPSQDDDDMNVELPSEDPEDGVGNVPLAAPETTTNGSTKASPPYNSTTSVKEEGRKSMNLFRLMCTFAQIQSRVYKNLYSVRAARQSDGELLNTIGALDSELEAWKDSIPLSFRPEHPIQAAHTPLILHVVCLHFAYYNCLTTIHRMSVHHGYWSNRLSEYAVQGLSSRPLNPRVFMSASLCVNAARTSIGLVRYIPQGDYACVWLVLYYPVSSLVTLFANILQNPQDARARSDLKLMSSVVSFLTMLERDVNEANGNVKRMLSVCAEFERIARVVLDKAEKDLRSGRNGKRKAGVSGMTERERAKEMRDRGEVEKAIAEGLEEGKTLEQMQVETQAPYRRPVQTPSLRASTGAGSSGAGNSPASWGGSQHSGGPEFGRSPMVRNMGDAEMGGYAQQQQQQLRQQQQQQMMGQSLEEQHFPFIPGLTSRRTMEFHSRTPAPPPPANFSQPQAALTDGYNNRGVSGFSPSNIDPLMAGDMGTGPFDANGNAGGFMSGIGGPTGSFQQPFVPQDLWQMPMTLEWDWAEGLGLGSFTPGAMFEGNGGGYMGGQ
ncbi:hypothetical protein LTR56_005555 [Elasticomyces elasticus]|nr:hypothetical protein LTR22_017142 [Elasticomyces elasticus]KAK3651747.1 hypothetical protein LTR56_005555 [Elasticomyces elasticus]KAK4913348.1 hypothetical protein LTR49_018329 [Elasticomyces elasticus]KAK5769154.1 hypothetical protein LTS12_000505 [Elasticomyces elasticus]